MDLEFQELSQRPADWNELIRNYSMKTLFHETAWHDHLLDIHPKGSMRYDEIRFDGKVVGHMAALELRKYGICVSGSPLPGTGTNYMGPLLTDPALLEHAVEAWLQHARRRGVMHFELSNPALEDRAMEALGFTVYPSVTHVVPLLGTQDEAWSALKSSCRNRIRKAQKNGLQAEIVEDPGIAGEYYEQFGEVYGKQGMVRPYGPDRPLSLFRHLQPAGRLLAVRIRQGDRTVATGLFPYDEHCIYYWGGASWVADHHLCPNELLHWTVIERAISMGIPRYNMCGGQSQFKDKFGGEDIPYNNYSRSANWMLRLGRNLVQRWHWFKLRLEGAAFARRPTNEG